MKSIKFLMLPSLFLILLSSCEKESENIFLGTWELDEFRIDCPSDGINNISVEAMDGCVEYEEEIFCLKLVFETDTAGSISLGEGGNSSSVLAFTYDYTTSSKSVNICVEGEDCMAFLLLDNRLMLDETEPECTAVEYFLNKN